MIARFRLVILFGLILPVVVAAGDEPTGRIRGIVRDADTRAPLVGANVTMEKTDLGAATDQEGSFVISDVPVGSYTLKIDYIGYQVYKQPDVIVRSGRTTSLQAELQISSLETESVQVTAGYFAGTEEALTSNTHFSFEEIRRSPGAAGDISRIVMALPSVAKINDQINSLVVRGGSPLENAFYVDHIEIPNINHFPAQGTSGGSMSILNVDLIRDVGFAAGGFGACYGDKLSSVMNIDYREGNRSEFDGQLDLNIAGFGAIAEGPLGNGSGSWLISGRRSYLDLVIGIMGLHHIPIYSDLQGKLVYDLTPRHRLALLNIMGSDYNSFGKDQARESDFPVYGREDHRENTLGFSWRALWNQKGYSVTSLAYTAAYFRRDFTEYASDALVIDKKSLERDVKLRSIHHFRIDPRHALEFGIEAKYLSHSYDNIFGAYTDILGQTTPRIVVSDDIAAGKLAGFISHEWHPFPKLKTTWGIRSDYFEYNRNTTLDPRLTIAYQATAVTALKFSLGRYNQTLPLYLLSQNQANRSLANPQADHFILGCEHLLREDTRLTLELYHKNYRYFPMDPQQPQLFVLDELFFRDGIFYGHEQLTDRGRAYSRGIELLIQKKLVEHLYGHISVSYFQSRYRDMDGVWRDRVVDNRIIFNIDGGYKPNREWEFSLRWVYAGGRPYTPFDIELSSTLNRGIFDATRINAERYPAYHSLKLRADRRFHFQRSNLIVYLSLWNAYNRKNVAAYFWNQAENRPATEYQWRITPIFGIEYEF